LNPIVHYRIHNCKPPVSVLSQPNPVHTPTSHFLKIYLTIILPSTPGSPQWALSLRVPHQNPIHASLLPHSCYMPRPSHSHHPHNIGWRAQIMKLLIMKFSPLPWYLVPLRPNILLDTLFSNTISLRSSLNVSDQVDITPPVKGHPMTCLRWHMWKVEL
jgi:hypothetical protein